jgi:hypothetical protein
MNAAAAVAADLPGKPDGRLPESTACSSRIGWNRQWSFYEIRETANPQLIMMQF